MGELLTFPSDRVGFRNDPSASSSDGTTPPPNNVVSHRDFLMRRFPGGRHDLPSLLASVSPSVSLDPVPVSPEVSKLLGQVSGLESAVNMNRFSSGDGEFLIPYGDGQIAIGSRNDRITTFFFKGRGPLSLFGKGFITISEEVTDCEISLVPLENEGQVGIKLGYQSGEKRTGFVDVGDSNFHESFAALIKEVRQLASAFATRPEQLVR